MDILNKTNSSLTISEQVLIEYIENHISELPEMKISELAEKTYTSNATIVRLSRKLGFAGFREFKEELIKQNEANKFIDKSVDFNMPIQDNRTAGDVIGSMTSLYRETINRVCSTLKPADIQTFGEYLNRADHIYIYAIGDTQATADVFINKIMKLNCHAVSAMARYEHVRISSNAGPNDCALVISYSGKHEALKQALPILKQRKCPVFTITAEKDSYASRMADHVIVIPDEETEDRIATFYSQLAFSYILNILYGMIYLKKHR